jgi:hypothetical protein
MREVVEAGELRRIARLAGARVADNDEPHARVIVDGLPQRYSGSRRRVDEQHDPHQLVGSSALDDRLERPAPHRVVSEANYPRVKR